MPAPPHQPRFGHGIDFEQASDPAHAVRLAQQPNTMFIGGLTKLIDLTEGDVEWPARLVDINRNGRPTSTSCRTAVCVSARSHGTATPQTTQWRACAARC